MRKNAWCLAVGIAWLGVFAHTPPTFLCKQKDMPQFVRRSPKQFLMKHGRGRVKMARIPYPAGPACHPIPITNRVSLSAQKVWMVLLGFGGYIYIGHSHDVFRLVPILERPIKGTTVSGQC